ncbi:Methylphloroacetophenone synthase [Colletotrichum sp. SAR 10_66]|nr:Methylphloroacetophenone synthase [Colletotrichum sp. SAR 10_66]
MGPQLTASSAQDSLVDVAIKLWKEGHNVQYWPFHRRQRHQYQSLSLPPYQFQKTRHWLPYIGLKHGAESPAGPSTEDPEPEEFLSLIKGDGSTESYFRISAKSERFQSLVKGHIMCEYASMPASAYIEAVSRAALKLQDLDLAAWRPTVEDLTMKAPVVLKPDEEPPEILLSMRRLDNSWPSWVFSITVEPTQKAGESKVEAQETTTGMVHLRERNDPRVTQEFRRFESLIGDCRWQNIMEHSDAEAMQGKHIYRAFNGVVQYSDDFKGIKAIASLGNEAAGVVRFSPSRYETLEQRLVDTPMIDSFLQFGGFLVNYFSTTATPDSLFVCHHIQRLQLGPAFSPDVKDWLVLANMTSENDENMSVDVYVSEAQTKKTVFVAFGGTTRHVVDLLVKVGIPFEYHFTDLSASLVQKAKTSFAGINGMTFGVLDIESEPADELTEAFHVIISTNCIHATRNITSSLANLRKMLREDGALALIEMTPTRQLPF